MKLTKANGRYEFVCEKEERYIAKDAGFRFSADGGRPVWSTTSARRALAVAAYADDALRAELVEKAKDEPDPTKITLRLEGTVWRYYSPDAASNGPAKNAQMRFKPDPIPHWWTESRDVAAKCFGQASALPIFVCSKEDQEILVEQIKSIVTAVEMSRATDAEIEITGLKKTLYPFQRAGVAFLAMHPRCFLGDEMGLGKTPQALAAIKAREGYPAVIICPASLKLNWQREALAWLPIEARDIFIAQGRMPPSATQLAALAPKLIIINYDLLPTWHKRLADYRPATVVCDESHYLKNSRAQRTQAVYELSQGQIENVWLLSGTAIMNRPRELEPQLSIIGKINDFGGGFKFLLRYCNGHKEAIRIRGGKVKQVWNFSGASHLDELNQKLRAGLMIRRLKSEVLTDLPPKVRQVIEIDHPDTGMAAFEASTWQKHETLRAELRAAVEIAKASDDPNEYANAIANLREGQRASFEEVSRVRHESALRKVPHVVEHVKDLLEEHDKCVVWAHHLDVIQQITDDLNAAGFETVCLTGAQNQDARQSAVDAFQNEAKCRVFVGSIMAAGVGLTLTAASMEVFAEMAWRPADISQAEDRCHRIGQRDVVVIHHLLFAGSIDAQMARTIIAKQEIIDKALDAPTNVNEWQNEARETAAEPEDFYPELPDKEEASEPDDMRIAFDLPATSRMTVAQVKQEAETISPEHIALVYKGLRTLAGMCDGAASLDGTGFNRMDVALGHLLASRPALTAAQACLGRKLLNRYRNTQLKGICDELWS